MGRHHKILDNDASAWVDDCELVDHSGSGRSSSSSISSTDAAWQASGDKLRRFGEQAKMLGSSAEVPFGMYRGRCGVQNLCILHPVFFSLQSESLFCDLENKQ